MLVEVHAGRQQQIAAPHGHRGALHVGPHPSPLTTNRKALWLWRGPGPPLRPERHEVGGGKLGVELLQLLVGFGRSNQLADASGNDTVSLPLEVWQTAFMQDAPEDVQRLVHGLLIPQPMSYFRETVAAVDPEALGIPASYVLATEDIALPPGEYAWAPRFPDRLGVTPVTCPGNHEALFTQSEALAAAIAGA